ncbi:MAG: agmatinase family protein [Chloroflexi bacterium]|nr:agmatinase family protein [Chloroflexota bacterium]
MATYLNPPEVVRRSHWEDRYEKRVANWFTPWDFQEKIDAGFIGAPLSRSSIMVSRASEAPNAIRNEFPGFTTYSPDFDVDIRNLKFRDVGDIKMFITDVKLSHSNIENGLGEVFAANSDFVPVIAGGDHSITCPAVKAFCKYHPGKVGIIQFDAHHDVRNFEDGGPTNGTPIRGILESGVNVDPKNIAQIGIHGFMNAAYYRQFCRETGITVITGREVEQRGINAAVEQALEVASDGTDYIYLTFDIDGVDATYAPGTPAPGPGGLNAWQAMEGVYAIGRHPKTKAMDLVCIDPSRDVSSITVRLGCTLILTFLAGMAQR